MNNLSFLLFSFKGRISRGQFWAVQGTWAVIYLLLVGIAEATGNSDGPNTIVSVIFVLFILASLWPLLAVQIKRWHDRNKSGWWCLIGLVPIIGGFWVLVECGCLPGEDEGNRFNA